MQTYKVTVTLESLVEADNATGAVARVCGAIRETFRAGNMSPLDVTDVRAVRVEPKEKP